MAIASTEQSRLELLSSLAETVATETDPTIIWQRAERTCSALIGHEMFTVLHYLDATGEVVRVHSNRPDVYPVGGKKRMQSTPWGELVLKQGKPFVGKDAAAIRWAYPDHETIIGMGLESALNLPIRYAGRTLGTLNLTHRSGYYHDRHLEAGTILAALLTPVLMPGKHEHLSDTTPEHVET